MVFQRWHEKAKLIDRVDLINSLLYGFVSGQDQAAIVEVLDNAKARGDLTQLVNLVGPNRLSFALDSIHNQQYHDLVGDLDKHWLQR